MPLTTKGHGVLKNMMKEYGSKKGKQVFYASINAKKKGSDKWHKMSNKSYSKGAIEHAMSKTK